MADVEVGTLYDLNKQIMAQLPPQDEITMNHNGTIIGDGFGQNQKHGFMLMCKERSDFTFLHITNYNFNAAIQELQEILQERGQILAIQYVHGEDCFEIGIKDKTNEVFVFMLFEAEGMICEV